MFPWKQREILTFEIPVHDSERAGLGMCVLHFIFIHNFKLNKKY